MRFKFKRHQLLRSVLTQRHNFNARRLLPVIVLTGALAAGALIVMPASSEGSTQNQNRLSAYVVASNRGPLPACHGDDCTEANFTQHFIYITNKNELTNVGGRRDTLPNAFVVSSVDESIFVDGVQFGSTETLTPPPNAVRRGVSGHWPATVTCPAPPDTCNIVGSPAILPGENTVIFWDGWFHGDEEPNGTYVLTFTVHGTLNGTPVDLTASGPGIRMTD
jgi:hypothetical protein